MEKIQPTHKAQPKARSAGNTEIARLGAGVICFGSGLDLLGNGALETGRSRLQLGGNGRVVNGLDRSLGGLRGRSGGSGSRVGSRGGTFSRKSLAHGEQQQQYHAATEHPSVFHKQSPPDLLCQHLNYVLPEESGTGSALVKNTH